VASAGLGPSYLDVTVTVDDNIITDIEVGTPATDPTSLDYQERFAAAVPDEVIGRDLGEATVGKLAGSSSLPRRVQRRDRADVRAGPRRGIGENRE